MRARDRLRPVIADWHQTVQRVAASTSRYVRRISRNINIYIYIQQKLIYFYSAASKVGYVDAVCCFIVLRKNRLTDISRFAFHRIPRLYPGYDS